VPYTQASTQRRPPEQSVAMQPVLRVRASKSSRRSQVRDRPTATGPRDVRRRLPDVPLRAPHRRLAVGGLRRGGARERLLPQRRAALRRARALTRRSGRRDRAPRDVAVLLLTEPLA